LQIDAVLLRLHVMKRDTLLARDLSLICALRAVLLGHDDVIGGAAPRRRPFPLDEKHSGVGQGRETNQSMKRPQRAQAKCNNLQAASYDLPDVQRPDEIFAPRGRLGAEQWTTAFIGER
jgi:hypothetical protein